MLGQNHPQLTARVDDLRTAACKLTGQLALLDGDVLANQHTTPSAQTGRAAVVANAVAQNSARGAADDRRTACGSIWAALCINASRQRKRRQNPINL